MCQILNKIINGLKDITKNNGTAQINIINFNEITKSNFYCVF